MRAALLTIALAVGCSSPEPASTPPLADAATDVADTGRPSVDARPLREAAVEIPPPPVPATLAETGLYSDFASRTLAPSVIPFDVTYPLWSDGAEKVRYLSVPAGKKIDTSDMDHWTFPIGTRAWKEFRKDSVLVETRYLEKTGEAPIGWRYVAYAWSADGKAAVAAPTGVVNALGTPHDVPSQEHCEQCHSGTRDGLVGVGAIQLSRESGKSPLATLAEKGLLSVPPGREFAPPGTGVVRDALGYLHGNCGYCHSDVGRWADARKLRFRVRVADTDPAMTPTYRTTVNVKMSHGDSEGNPYIGIVPGDPAGSHVFERMAKRDFWAMPPVGSEVIDPAGVALIRSWIEGMK